MLPVTRIGRSCSRGALAVLVAGIWLLAPVGSATATPVSYTLNLGAGTINGNDLTSVLVFETDGSQTFLDFPYTVAGNGTQILTHESPFVPTESLIVGLDLASPVQGDNKTHVVMFMNDAFAQTAIGVLFSQVFPNTRHSGFISQLTAAEAGDVTAESWLQSFFLTGDGAAASFATTGSATAVEFTCGAAIFAHEPPPPGCPGFVQVPEPNSLALLALGLAGLGFSRRKRV